MMSNAQVIELDDALRATRAPFDKIPVVDIAALVNGTDPSQTAKDINWALSNVGFMYVKNHGIDPQLVTQAFDQTKKFFDLPLADKMSLHVEKSGVALRGYTEMFGENTDPTKTKDLKECFDLGPERAGTSTPFFGANQWPDATVLPEFQPVIYQYHEAMCGLYKTLRRGLALSLGLEPSYFEAKMRDPITIQRLIHYPPQSGKIDEAVMGIGAHTDYGHMTILAQDDVGGLQVMNRDGVWVEAPLIENTFVINIGDLMQRLTNDIYLANLHRVVNISGRQRYSFPFFADADYDAQIAPIPSCVSAENPSRYAPVTCGEYKFSRFVDTFPHLAQHA